MALKTILAIDPGITTGWAHVDACGHVESGVVTFAVGRGESPGMRFYRFWTWLNTFLPRTEIVIYELPHLRGGFASGFLVGLTSRIEEWTARNGLDLWPLHSKTLKRVSTGSGLADKEKMLAAARMRYIGRDIATHDEADALLMLWHAVEQIDARMLAVLAAEPVHSTNSKPYVYPDR